MTDYEVTILHINSPESLRRLREIVQERSARGRVTRIIGPDGFLSTQEELFAQAGREIQDRTASIQASVRNLPGMDPDAAPGDQSPMSSDLELRLHRQRPGDPHITQAIENQELEDDSQAHRAFLEAGYRAGIMSW